VCKRGGNGDSIENGLGKRKKIAAVNGAEISGGGDRQRMIRKKENQKVRVLPRKAWGRGNSLGEEAVQL